MSTYTDPDSGATIEFSRMRRVTETARLRANETVDEIYLSDLRRLVERTAHIPGTAIVHPAEDGIDINYAENEEPGGEIDIPDDVCLEVDETTIFSDEAMATLRERLQRERAWNSKATS